MKVTPAHKAFHKIIASGFNRSFSEPRNLGTYTQKLLVSDQVWEHTLTNLRELAEARRIIELPSFSTKGSLSVEDGEKLTQRVCKSLGRP